MDELNIKIKYTLDNNSSSTVKQQTKKLEEELQKTPIQLKIEAVTGIASHEMSKVAKNYEKVWEKAFFNQRQMAIKNAEDIKNTYNSQLFENFNKSIGIGTTNNNSAKDAVQVFQPIFDAEDRALEIQKTKVANFWDTFNQKVGIGVSSGESAKQASQAFQPIFDQEDKAIEISKAKINNFGIRLINQ
jgi:hypothetical protein